MPLVIVAIGVILLLLLMIRFKMNGFIALVLVALAVGLMQGMPLDKVIGSIKAGVGGTLGSLALIMGFGAMLGKMLADCGGAQRIATTLIAKFGKKHIQWAVVLTGFTVGFALFYEVGFVLMLMRRAINKGEKRDKCLCCCVTNREKELQKQSEVTRRDEPNYRISFVLAQI